MFNYLLHSCGSGKLCLKKKKRKWLLFYSLQTEPSSQVNASHVIFSICGNNKGGKKKKISIEKVYAASPAILCLLGWVAVAPKRSFSGAFRF